MATTGTQQPPCSAEAIKIIQDAKKLAASTEHPFVRLHACLPIVQNPRITGLDKYTAMGVLVDGVKVYSNDTSMKTLQQLGVVEELGLACCDPANGMVEFAGHWPEAIHDARREIAKIGLRLALKDNGCPMACPSPGVHVGTGGTNAAGGMEIIVSAGMDVGDITAAVPLVKSLLAKVPNSSVIFPIGSSQKKISEFCNALAGQDINKGLGKKQDAVDGQDDRSEMVSLGDAADCEQLVQAGVSTGEATRDGSVAPSVASESTVGQTDR